ncbi:MAG TPA: MFS transporter, partial [Alteromonas sp.]|nr:MFS transporter [Alteromonas sp.]
KPRYLDNNIAQTPALATNALLNELIAVQGRFVMLYQSAVYNKHDDIRLFQQQARVIEALLQEVSEFIVNLETAAL